MPRLRRTVASAAALAALAAGAIVVPMTEAGAATACSLDQLVPTIARAEVNQGLPGYGVNRKNASLKNPLVWGKHSIVKAYLTLPTTCDTSNGSISVTTGSTLGISGGNLQSATVSSATSGVVAGLTPVENSTADPIWAVDGKHLAPSATGPTDITFTASVKYTARVGTSTRTGTTLPHTFTVTFDAPSNAMRVLVVPMGDAASSTAQLTPAGHANVQGAMKTLSRLLPVASGVASLTDQVATGPAPGLRYTVDSGIVDLGPQGLKYMDLSSVVAKLSPKPFCGSDANSAGITRQLDAFLESWNNMNPNAKANRVLGVIDETVSSATNCWLGGASVGGTAGWIRVNSKTGSSPNWGALAGMELGHTLALSPMASSGGETPCANNYGDSGFHSPNEKADTCGHFTNGAWRIGRAFNVDKATFMSSPATSINRSVMRLTGDGTWVNDAVLFELQDFQVAQCQMQLTTTASSTACGTSPTVGGFAPAAPAERYHISGSIELSGGGSSASVADSFVTTSSFETYPDPSSRWQGRFVDANNLPVGAPEGVVVRGNHTAHPADGHDHEPEFLDFLSTRPVPEGAVAYELLDTQAVPVAAIYRSGIEGPAPVVTTTTIGIDPGPMEPATATNWSNTPAAGVSESRPAMGAGLVAYTTSTGVKVAPLGDATKAVAVPGAGAGSTNPAFTPTSGNASTLFFEDANGSIFMSSVSWSGNTAGPGIQLSATPTRVYDSGLGIGLGIAPARRPTPSPTGNRVAVEYAGRIYVVYLTPTQGQPLGCSLPGVVILNSCEQVTGSRPPLGQGTDANPVWLPGQERIAFDRAGGISVVDLATQSVSTLLTSGSHGAAAGDLFVYEQAGNIYGFRRSGGPTFQVTSAGADAWPAVRQSGNDGTVLLQRQFSAPSQLDLMRVELASRGPNGSIVIRGEGTFSVDPSHRRAQFGRLCPDGREEVADAGVEPTWSDGATSGFEMVFNPASLPTLGCQGGKWTIQLSDGWQLSDRVTIGDAPAGSRKPVTAIVTPEDDTSVRVGHVVGAVGVGYTADRTVLPPSALSWKVTPPSGTALTFNGVDRIHFNAALPGEYLIDLTAKDSTNPDPATNTATARTSFVVVGNVPPVPVMDSPLPGTYALNSVVTLSGRATDDLDGDVPASSLSFRAVAPNGTSQLFVGTSSASLTLSSPGRWTVSLIAEDSEGAVAQVSAVLDVSHVANVQFNPTTMNVPALPSDPIWVTVNVTLPGQDLTKVTPNTLRVVRIGSFTAANDPSFPDLRGGCLPSGCSSQNDWRVSTKPSQTGTVQFDRTTLANYLNAKGLTGLVQIEIAGSAPTFSFTGFDPNAPFVQSS